jgi:ADP-heptose:LPS heptosyltransferase
MQLTPKIALFTSQRDGVRVAKRFANKIWRWPIVRVTRELDLVNYGGLGDVLLCTPALRELRRINPRAVIRFYSRWPDAVQKLPYIDEVLPLEATPLGSIQLCYETVKYPKRHLAKVIGESASIRVTDVRPDVSSDPDITDRYREVWRNLPRPWIAIQRRASRWTVNKDWPAEYWDRLLTNLCLTAAVIEIGEPSGELRAISSPNFVDLRGQTNLEELLGVIAAADVLVAPVSGPIHVAAAARTPSVVIYGGYEHPINTMYEGNIALYTELECSPCWLRTLCPYDRKCLSAIKVETVEEAVWKIVRRRRSVCFV